MLNLEKKFKNHLNNPMIYIFILTVIYILVLIRTAWISDDAAITLRTILNFLHGFGPTFNITERVQAYTHPLWFFILFLGSFISGNVFYTVFFTAITVSVLALAFLLHSASRNLWIIFFISLSAFLSKAFIDFSTSGLENPISHLLLFFAVSSAAINIEMRHKSLVRFFLICSCVYLNRPDLIVLVFPLAAYLARQGMHNPKQLRTDLLFATVPVIIWMTFSLFYYGFIFPNTAYAKLGTGIDIIERVIQGLRYFLHSIYTDPVTLFVIASGLTIGLTSSHLSQLLSLGVILYLAYILYIGGDFMEGRFLTAPFFISLIVFSKEIKRESVAVFFTITVAILGSVSIYPNLIAGSDYSNTTIAEDGIADERGFYFQRFGLLTANEETFALPQWTLYDRKVEVICGGLGFSSIKQGPSVHHIDTCALTDPLLARLPAKKNPNWRIGHFYRQLPTNYKESIERDENILTDLKTAHYWESIRTITRGKLLDKNRILEIFKLHLGLVEKPDLEMYKNENIPI